MTHIDLLVRFLSVLSGFASLLGIVVFSKGVGSRAFKYYFMCSLYLFLYHLHMFLYVYVLAANFKLLNYQNIISVTVLYWITSNYTVSAVRATSEILNTKKIRIVKIGCNVIYFAFSLLYLLSFKSENMKVVADTVYRNLLIGGNFVKLPAFFVCFFFLWKKYKFMENRTVKKMLKAFSIVMIIYSFLIVLEYILYNINSWYLKGTSLGAYHFIYLAWNIVSSYILFKSINGNLAEDNKSEIFNSYGFTQREEDVLKQMLSSESVHEIGSLLYISPRTVEKHISNIYKKVGVNSRSELLGVMKKLV